MATATNEMECLRDLDFWTFYSSLCMINKVCPLRSVIKHLKGTELCCPVEAIRSEHWKFLLEALSVNNTLTKVHLRSEKQAKDFIGPLILKQRKRRKSDRGFPLPYGLQARNLTEICRSLSSCLKLSYSLNILKLDHLPLKLEDIELLSVGLKKCKLTELSIAACLLDDECIQIICESLKSSFIEWIDFTSCNLTIEGVKHIAELIKCHGNRRRSEAWPDTLRYRFPVLDNLRGLTRISLNDNAGVDDEACQVLAESVMDDLWIKALDLQKCHITDEGATSLLQVLTFNCILEVLDLQWNFISDDIVQRIMVQLELNNSGKSLKYEKIPLAIENERKVKKMPRRNTTFKIKINKKNPVRIRAVKNISKRSPVKEASAQSMCDKATLTESLFSLEDEIDCENGHSNTHLTRKYLACLAHAKKQQQHLVKKLKILTLENHFLRDALHKQTIPEGMILIDNDTYNSVTETFEKLDNFLAAMKENGWVSLKDLDANIIRTLIFHDIKVPTSDQDKLFGLEPMHEDSSRYKPENPSSSQMNYTRSKGPSTTKLDHEVCTCESAKNIDSSKQHVLNNEKAMASGERNISTDDDQSKNSNKKNLLIRPLDRTLVRKIFECMQRIHNTPNSSSSGKPSSGELPKKFVVQTVRPKQGADGHISKAATKQKNRFEGAECLHHHKEPIKCSLKEAMESQMKKKNEKMSLDHHTQFKPPSLSENNSWDSSCDFIPPRKTAKKAKMNKNSFVQDEDSSSKDRRAKVDTASQSLPSMTFDNSQLTSQLKKLSLNSDIPQGATDSYDNSDKELQSKSNKEISNNSQSSNSLPSTHSKSNSSQTTSTSKKSEAVVREILSQGIRTKSKSTLPTQSSQENKPVDRSDARSYLESVESSEATDKDVKSLSEAENAPVDFEITQKQKSSESPIKDQNVAAIMWLLNEDSTESNPSDSSDSEPEVLSKTNSNKIPEKCLTKENSKIHQQPKSKVLDDIGIPSLSDITTVTSRSINSIMYELSESDKV